MASRFLILNANGVSTNKPNNLTNMQTTNSTQSGTSAAAIATEAYYQWLQAGKPAGRDQEFWLRAEARLLNPSTSAKATEKKAATTSGSKVKAAVKR